MRMVRTPPRKGGARAETCPVPNSQCFRGFGETRFATLTPEADKVRGVGVPLGAGEVVVVGFWG